MKACPVCYAALPSEAEHCPACGAAVRRSDDEIEPRGFDLSWFGSDPARWDTESLVFSPDAGEGTVDEPGMDDIVADTAPAVLPAGAAPVTVPMGFDSSARIAETEAGLGPSHDRPQAAETVVTGEPDPEPEVADDPLLGQVVAERFLIKEAIGAGGVGKVYRAVQLDLDRPAALKVLHAEFAQNPTIKERFHREARAGSQLKHPGAVDIYDHGEWEDQLYLAMEFLDGPNLYDVLLERFPLDPAYVAEVVADACDVLQVAHDLNIIHRDLKPDNIVEARGAMGQPRIKVVDFGLVVLLEETWDSRLTQEGMIMGTPAYMSPEQCRAETLDGRSDVYSMGVVLYELLCGLPPFAGDTPNDLVMAQILDMPTPPSRANPGLFVPAVLDTLTMQTLAKDRDARPESAAALAAELRRLLALGFEQPVEAPSSRKGPLAAGDRLARAQAMGIPSPGAGKKAIRAHRPDRDLLLCVQLSETPGPGGGSTVADLLSGRGWVAVGPLALSTATARVAGAPTVRVVVDLGLEPERGLQTLEPLLIAGKLRPQQLVVIGPADAFDAAHRALELGLFEYVARETWPSKLPRCLRQMRRRLRTVS